MRDEGRSDQHERELERQFADNVARVAEQLRDRGVELRGDESPEMLVTLLEYVERFELAVQNRGGDLMVDEPPRGEDAEPDDPRFVVPQRKRGESAEDYLARIHGATAQVLDMAPRTGLEPAGPADADLMSGGTARESPDRKRAAPDEPPSPRAP